MMYKISGSGGTSSQSNGASGVPTVFGIPSSSVTSTLYYLDAGAGIKVTDEFRFELDGLVTGMFSARRAVNLVASLSYGFL